MNLVSPEMTSSGTPFRVVVKAGRLTAYLGDPMNGTSRSTSSIRPFVRIGLLVLAVGLLVASCTRETKRPQSATPARTRITYAMPITVAAIPAYVALDKGFWAAEGLDVDAKMVSAGRLALDALLAKNAQVMSVSETPLVHAIVQGNKIFIVATVGEHKETKLIVRT